MKRREPRVGRYLIYGIIDPRDRCLRYIGKTHKRREIRLSEHVQDAVEGANRPLHRWIRELIASGFHPEVFVLHRVPPELSWEEAEKTAIQSWRKWPLDQLPYVHPPQTQKSRAARIDKVELLNIRDGG